MEAVTENDQSEAVTRRREAGEFLRSRRERLTPKQIGMPVGARRRTPGLRREEVATLAGVGTTWYTWLEQGRDIRPSDEMLSALSRALRLDAAETKHLFALHSRAEPEGLSRSEEQVSEATRRLLDGLTHQPAYLLGRRWDVLAWNRAAEAVFGRYGRLQGDERNALYLVFVDPDHRLLLLDWEALARTTLAMFRADCARYSGDVDFARLIALLQSRSPEFRQWWAQRELLAPVVGKKRVDHPSAGRMIFEYTSLGVSDSPDMKLVVFTPLQEENTAQKLQDLLHA